MTTSFTTTDTTRPGGAPDSVAALWPAPQPIPSGLPPVPAFDGRLLPSALAPWVADIAERAQCPPAFVAVGALVAAAAVIGRQVAIRPKRADDWTVIPNLWGLAVGRPGLMKSAALAEALKPLEPLIADARIAYERERVTHRFRHAAHRAREQALTRRLREAVAQDDPTEDLRYAFEVPEVPPLREQRYVVNDTTVEKLGELLNQNPNGLLLFRDELSGFLRLMARPGHENDRGFYCEAWNGTGAYTYDRLGRGTLRIEAACVSVLGGIQPGPLAAYLHETFAGGGDDGLLPRFQLAVFPDPPPRWRNIDRWPDAEARVRAFAIFRQLATLDLAALAAEELTPGERPFLRFAPDAQARFDAWRAELEATLRREDDHPVLLSHLAKYRSLMPSLALIVHLIDAVDRGTRGPVSRAAAEQAAAWCTYLEAHARRLYASVTDPARVAAALLAGKLARGRLPTPFTARDVYRNAWTGLTEPRVVRHTLALLADLGWLRAEPARAGDGGRPTVRWHINPTGRGARHHESARRGTAKTAKTGIPPS
jgi:putative DNA primase/helicase